MKNLYNIGAVYKYKQRMPLAILTIVLDAGTTAAATAATMPTEHHTRKYPLWIKTFLEHNSEMNKSEKNNIT